MKIIIATQHTEINLTNYPKENREFIDNTSRSISYGLGFLHVAHYVLLSRMLIPYYLKDNIQDERRHGHFTQFSTYLNKGRHEKRALGYVD